MQNPVGLRGYRSIRLLACVYKFLSKVFSNQLKEVLLSIISLFQGAFVGDNQIWMVSSWLMSSLTVGSEHGKRLWF